MKGIKELINSNNNEISRIENLILSDNNETNKEDLLKQLKLLYEKKNKINNLYKEILNIENYTEDNDEKIVDKKEANTDAKNSDININNQKPIKRKNSNTYIYFIIIV